MPRRVKSFVRQCSPLFALLAMLDYSIAFCFCHFWHPAAYLDSMAHANSQTCDIAANTRSYTLSFTLLEITLLNVDMGRDHVIA